MEDAEKKINMAKPKGKQEMGYKPSLRFGVDKRVIYLNGKRQWKKSPTNSLKETFNKGEPIDQGSIATPINLHG